MQWQKKGFIFVADGHRDWMDSYSQVPTPLVFDDFIRVYFSTRPKNLVDGKPVAYIGYVDVDILDCTKVLNISQEPIISLGDTGTFDEFGTHPVSSLWFKGEIWLYYVGWTRLQSVPYNRAIGLAISKDKGKTFSRYGKGPVLGAAPNEPFLQQGPSVKIFNDKWHMWYLSGVKWIEDGGLMESVYQIMHATSDDGIHWLREGKPIMPEVVENECQAGQAIIKKDGKYHMWFSFRHGLDFRNAERGYRMGYAYSEDLESWHRDDSKAGIGLSESGWDSGMVCYPQICEAAGKYLMFYSGNYFGREGFGYAELVE